MAKIALLLPLLLLMGADVDPPKPLAAWVILSEQNGDQTIRAVAVQIDATHAVVGTHSETSALTVKDGEQETKEIDLIAIQDLYKLGAAAPIKRGIVVVCSAPPPST